MGERWPTSSGHYLHLPHTHLHGPATAGDAITLIKNHVDGGHGTKDTVLRDLFDFDAVAKVNAWPMITDTPPDPTSNVFNNQCDPAETSKTVEVTFKDGTTEEFTFTPDREVMSYWNTTCRGGGPRLTAGQSKRVHQALLEGNRRHLVELAVLYYGVFGEGDRSQTRAISWSLNDFAQRYDADLKAGRRGVHMQAYDIGGGQIRYDGVWEPAAGIGQTRAIGWSLNDFAQRYDAELKAGRRGVHMQAYDIGGGQICYDGIWNSGGDRAQSRAIGLHVDTSLASSQLVVETLGEIIQGPPMPPRPCVVSTSIPAVSPMR